MDITYTFPIYGKRSRLPIASCLLPIARRKTGRHVCERANPRLQRAAVPPRKTRRSLGGPALHSPVPPRAALQSHRHLPPLDSLARRPAPVSLRDHLPGRQRSQCRTGVCPSADYVSSGASHLPPSPRSVRLGFPRKISKPLTGNSQPRVRVAVVSAPVKSAQNSGRGEPAAASPGAPKACSSFQHLRAIPMRISAIKTSTKTNAKSKATMIIKMPMGTSPQVCANRISGRTRKQSTTSAHYTATHAAITANCARRCPA